MGKVVITGGSGYVGFRLGCSILKEQNTLTDKPETVVLFDTRHPHEPLPAGMEVYVGDICSAVDLNRALQGASIVFHVASYGMSGLEGMLEDKIQQINVTGTQNVIDACQRQGVGRLVYVSSYNAVFDGVTPIVAGTEATTHYVTRANCSDPYSLTKAIAEQLVLGANGTQHSTSDGQGTACLRTCALRPAAIWGPGEQRHMTRIVRMARQGYLCVMFGEASSLVDFVHVDNLIAACLLAVRALEGEAKAGGKAYFINDAQPVNNFVHFQQIMEGLGYTWPTVRLPYWLVHLVALLLEVVAAVVRNITGRILIVPLLTRTEVAKCAITHYAKCDLAREELGYLPLSHGFEATIEWYKVRKFGPVPVPAEVQAVRMVRNVRLCLALFMVTLIVIQWRMKSQVSLVTA